VAWMSNVATNWMGDHGFLHYLKVRLLAFCYVGDTVWLNAQVTDKRVEDGVNFVDLELEATNQRSETIARGVATVALLSKSNPSQPVAPIEPKDGETVF